MTETVDKHALANGLVVLGEPMAGVQSAAFSFMVPWGAARMPDGCCGASNVIEDWIFRGAGERDSRALGDAMDGLGLHRSSSVGSSFVTVGAALEAGNLASALELYADVLVRPLLTDEQFEPARQLAIEQIRGLDDDPRHKVMLKLREQFYPHPLGRSTVGHIEELKRLTARRTRQIVAELLNPGEIIFAVAGRYDFDAVCRQMEQLFADVEAREGTLDESRTQQERRKHIETKGEQVHIGLMTETVPPGHEDYYNARVAVSVLSGGMSSRLFTEVRDFFGPLTTQALEQSSFLIDRLVERS
jgi:predicted Zn-dependent peptidase